MSDVNLVVLSGRLTKEPTAYKSKDGEFFVCYTLAINEVYKDKKYVTFIPCLVFRKNIIEYAVGCMRKGTKVHVTGKLKAYRGKDGQMTMSVIVKEHSIIAQPKDTEVKEIEENSVEDCPMDVEEKLKQNLNN